MWKKKETEPAGESDESPISIPDALMALSKGGIVIDVRSEADYTKGHIPGARFVDIRELRDDPMTAVWGSDPLAMMDPATKDKLIVVVSVAPKYADVVSQLLRLAGLKARPLEGGLIGWIRDGQILVPGEPD